MPDTTNTKSDLEILTQLNADFVASAQNGDVRRFEQILAEDFMASLPDFLLRDKKQFLDMMAAPRPFTELKADEVRIRLLIDSQDTLGFSALSGVRPMIETMPLSRAPEAYARMMRAEARFRMVLTMAEQH